MSRAHRLSASVVALFAAVGVARLASAADADGLAPYMRVLGLTMNHSKFDEARHQLGATQDTHGDQGVVICYQGPDGTTLVLASLGDMGGGPTILEYQLLDRTALAHNIPSTSMPPCSPLSSLTRSVRVGGTLGLGMSRSEAEKLLGRPDAATSTVLEYRSAEDLGEGEGESGRYRYLRIEFSDDKAVAIRGEELVSC